MRTKMRTSNKLLLLTLALMIVSVVVYDFELKAAYQKGDYRDKFRNFVSLGYKNFDKIELNSSTAINVMLVKGPFKVMSDPNAMEYVTITQHGNTLTINANFKYNYQNARSDYVLYISCPQLSSLKTDARYMADETEVVDTLAGDNFNWKPTVIKGFSADSLYIQEDHASNVMLENNNIGTLHAITGISNGSASNLCIAQNNQFIKTDLDIRNKSRLWIKDKTDHDFNYRLADSAKLILNGSAQRGYIRKIQLSVP